MDFTPQQDRALSAVSRWHRDPQQPVFRLFGFAGTGKTTLAKHLAANATGEVLFAAFTGKAAQVLTNKGAPATTIHRLIYWSQVRSRVRLLELKAELVTAIKTHEHERIKDLVKRIKDEEAECRRPRFTLAEDSPLRAASLLIVDECSMVDARVGRDLLSFDVPVLVLGDPAQLPPVKGGGYFTDAEPDILLDEVHRQALDSPVLRMATDVREGRGLTPGTYGASLVQRGGRLDPERVAGADQLLVGTHATRRTSNLRLRGLLGIEGEGVVPGDRLVCLKNNYALEMMNGSLWNVADVTNDGALLADLVSQDDGSPREGVELCVGDVPAFMDETQAAVDYGYALTVHKAQGSQWKHVAILDESSAFRNFARNWLYTAVTRASDAVTVLMR